MTASPLHPADAEAIAKAVRVEPALVGLRRASDAVGLEPTTLLHAGPAFKSPAEITRPVLNSAAVALVHEGAAQDFAAAERMIREGRARLEPAQDRDVVTPLAFVVGASMWLQEVVDAGDAGRRAYAPINGGAKPEPRLGLMAEGVRDHLAWLNGEFADVLAGALGEPVPLIPIAKNALAEGDDCHGRTPAATRALAAIVAARYRAGAAAERATAFLAAGPSFFLNIWMAACRCMLKAAVGVAGASLVTAAGGNGAKTGIQLAGLPGRWFTAPAEPPRGRLDSGMPAARALGAIGDSAIVDALGLGAMAMHLAPEQEKGLGAFMPEGWRELPGLLLAAEHPAFAPIGLRVGLTARAVAAVKREPVVSLGILDREGTLGRLGGGIYRAPLRLFEEALAALAALGR
jgi:hypothetical protein